jgi:hypothetical protein
VELEDRVRQVARDAVRGDEEIHDEIRKQTFETLAEQKVEASFFAAGVVLQMIAATLLLVC